MIEEISIVENVSKVKELLNYKMHKLSPKKYLFSIGHLMMTLFQM
jgi:hypothetical protein